jgi:glutathione S-transferase
MKPNTSRIIRMIVQPQAFGDKQPQPDDIRKEEDEFFKKLLPSLEKQLHDKKFFCCGSFTIADIQYYCEI